MPLVLSREERRTHLDVFGGSGQGKSKVFELLVRNDIGKFGACVIDPSENGQTVRDILGYCCHVGFEKVVLIDPHDFSGFKKVPVMNPLKYSTPAADNVGNMVDALGILWASNFSDRLGFLSLASSLLSVLHKTRYTLPDSQHFLKRSSVRQRNRILEGIPAGDPHVQTLNETKSGMVFESIANRFSYFYKDEWLRLMFGSKKTGLNFRQLIKEKYLILVNLDPQGVWGSSQNEQRLLGTMIINEVTSAIHHLRQKTDWNDPYYLYIDEVGDYSTPKIAYILDKKRKTGLSFTVAHQRFDQLSDKNVLSAIRGMANKVMFQTMMQEDRATMIRDMGFEEQAQMVHELRRLRVQEAAVAIGKAKPRIVDIESVPSYPQNPRRILDYKIKIYNQPFYRDPREINLEIHARLRTDNVSSFKPRGHVSEPKGGNLEGIGGSEVHDRRPIGGDSGPRKGKTFFDSQAPKDPHVRPGVRRRDKAASEDAEGRPGKGPPKAKRVRAKAMEPPGNQEAD
jgi:hypothetical protein